MAKRKPTRKRKLQAKARPESKPKEVVYLFGAGATQAEVEYLGAQRVNLLMRDDNRFGEGVSTRILKRTGRAGATFLGEDHGVDIEKLISLLTASGIGQHSELAEKMRDYYFEEIRGRLASAKVIDSPELAVCLLEMHKDSRFTREVETLSGIFTTNHDGLLQIATGTVFGAVNIGFPFTSEHFIVADADSVPPILQLHGSFTWSFGVPIEVTRLQVGSRYVPGGIWIPPTILKESKNYPFNKLMGLAYELLAKRCDVLRVIGSSMTQNDWNVLSLIFNAQRHREVLTGAAFRIELIMPHDAGEEIRQLCSYLKNVTPIGYLTDGEFGTYKEGKLPAESELNNQFAYWLKQKIYYHRTNNAFGVLGPTMAKVVGETR